MKKFLTALGLALVAIPCLGAPTIRISGSGGSTGGASLTASNTFVSPSTNTFQGAIAVSTVNALSPTSMNIYMLANSTSDTQAHDIYAGTVTVQGGDGTNTTGSFTNGGATLTVGPGDTNRTGGAVVLTGGADGSGGGGGAGASVTVGGSKNGDPGDVFIAGNTNTNSSSSRGGDVFLTSGRGVYNPGDIFITASDALNGGGAAGHGYVVNTCSSNSGGAGGAHIWKSGSTEIMRLIYTGSLGIGTATPASKLHLSSGTITIDGSGAPTTSQALCLATGGALGHCTSVVGAGGACTCVSP